MCTPNYSPQLSRGYWALLGAIPHSNLGAAASVPDTTGLIPQKIAEILGAGVRRNGVFRKDRLGLPVRLI
jgi:hypothetical protein